MKVKIVDNKSDATPPITTTPEISTSTNNTKSSSEPCNDSAIVKSIKLLFLNLNLVTDEINNILNTKHKINTKYQKQKKQRNQKHTNATTRNMDSNATLCFLLVIN